MAVRIVRDRVLVRVPATSANLGPGFDVLGLALGLWDEITVRAIAGESLVHVDGEGAGQVPTDESHLVVRAVRAGLEAAGAPQAGLELHCRNAIPHGRGLGSSAAAVVAGLLAARGMLSEPEALDDARILALATEFEGHPDNAAPAIHGGATLTWSDSEGPHAERVPLGESMRPTVLVPGERLSTSAARQALPTHVPLVEATFNISRAALLILALGGRPELLLPATADRLHQSRRAGVMAPTLEAVTALREAGWPAVVSGAGPSVLVFEALDSATSEALSARGWRVLHPDVARRGAEIVTL
ncbi:homoserine kinase [Bogoriella caseilytica]|uniref:Homoserine kinase n=1 Tax=Bogoriella caseilytica TaxID=56055 RepID=A0A3N2BEW3_9MICO|nr:homoserine kinase [Bogoriella caseilytica]